MRAICLSLCHCLYLNPTEERGICRLRERGIERERERELERERERERDR
jgi:hypothetical protein